MKIYNKFILGCFTKPFFASFLFILFIFLMQFLWKYIDDLAGKGLDWFNIFTLIFYSTMKFVPLAIPISIMVASIMTFGSLAEKNESIALKCYGISLKKILQPLIFLITILTLISFLFSNHILPYTNLKSISLLWDIRKQKPAVNFNEGEFYDEIDNFSIKVNKKKGEILEDIIIYCHEKSGKNKKVFIDRNFGSDDGINIHRHTKGL